MHFFPKIDNQERFEEKLLRQPPRGPIVFRGTVKLHGTNVCIVESSDGHLYGQGHGRVFQAGETGRQTFGFVQFLDQPDRAAAIRRMFDAVRTAARQQFRREDPTAPAGDEKLTVLYYGEFCGRGIQAGVAISELPERAFFGFALKVIREATGTHRWLNLRLLSATLPEATECPAQRLYSVHRFPGATCRIVVDPADLPAARTAVRELVARVEHRCPVAAALGHEGTGEGWVFCANEEPCEGAPEAKTEAAAARGKEWAWLARAFKAKADRFRDTRPATEAKAAGGGPQQAVRAFVERAVTEVRLRKGIDALREAGAAADAAPAWSKKVVPRLAEWVLNDLLVEEDSEVAALGLSGGAGRRTLTAAVTTTTAGLLTALLDQLNLEEAERSLP